MKRNTKSQLIVFLSSTLTKTNFLKSVLSIIMVVLILVPLIGCGKAKGPSFKDGQYINAEGKVMQANEVTLDLISTIHYKLKYDELTESAKRKHVVTLYLEYHIPASNSTQTNGKNTVIDLVAGFDPKLPPVYEGRLDLADGIVSRASTILSLADIYAKFKDDSGFENFVNKMSKTCELADVVFKFSKACYIVSDLTNNQNLENKQEYCNDVIDALSLITSNVPIFDDYFTESLEVVKVGLQKVLESYEMREKMYSILIKEIDPNAQTIFSVNDTFAMMGNNQFWSNGPYISQVLAKQEKLKMIPAGEPYECFRDYILWRVPFELQDDNKCSHKWGPSTIVKQPTCAEEGIKSFTCTLCQETRESKIEKTKHTFEEKVIPPTSQKMGYSVFTCKVCGYYFMDKLTNQLTILATWSGDGKQEHSKNRTFVFNVYSMSKNSISGDLDVYTVISGKTKHTHQTTFSGTGKATEEGYEYLLKFDKSVTFGVVPSYTYTELTIYYNTAKDTFTFKEMYQVTMTRKK